MTNSDLFIWREMCRIFYHEQECNQAYVEERGKGFVYLSGGQEAIAPAVAAAFVEADIRPNVFGQHRNHDIMVAFGADMTKVRDELLGLPTGTTCGVGGDPCHHDLDAKYGTIYGHIGLVGDNIPLAVGMAYGSNEMLRYSVWSVCFIGDSSVEEETFGPSLGFAATHNLPVLFVELDNNLSVITEVSKRRSWDSLKVASAYGLAAMSLDDDPFLIYLTVSSAINARRPTYLHIKTNRKYRHVSFGLNDTPMRWDRMAMVRDEMYKNYGDKARAIEADAIREMARLWDTNTQI